MTTHAYAPAIVPTNQRFSTEVLAAARRLLNRFGRFTVRLNGVSGKVVHFEVMSESNPNVTHPVEYDTVNKTFRCECKGGFYGNACKHCAVITLVLDLPE